jgi:DNA-directed RNA polymerase beta' subunit
VGFTYFITRVFGDTSDMNIAKVPRFYFKLLSMGLRSHFNYIMNLVETIDRMDRIHKLIRQEATGTPDEFARQIRVSRRQLYNILEKLKDSGADIKYNHHKCTYYYANNFDFCIKISTNSTSE